MSKFRFRLATLRRLRENHRDEQRGRLAEAYQAEAILAERRQQVADELDGVERLQRTVLHPGATDVNRLLDAQRYLLALRAQQGTLQNQMRLLDEEIERRRLAVVEADRQVRVLDKLEDRQREQHRREQLRLETKQYDEVAVLQAGRLSEPGEDER